MILSRADARQIILNSQGLLGNHFGTGKQAALKTIEQLGYVQIDTLAVVSRAHHHAVWSRTKNYQEVFLNQLLQEKKIFEYWGHAASYLPMNQYRFSLPRKMIYAQGKSHWFGQDQKMKKRVLDRIKQEGALQSKDFEHHRINSGKWYEWKPAKRALEQLFMEGKLMVVERKNFQKVYDLSERVLPSEIDVTVPSEDEYAEHLILNAISANGIATLGEISYLRGHTRNLIAKNIKRLLKGGLITAIQIHGIDKIVYYGIKEQCDLVLNKKKKKLLDCHILSPFDNLLIQRKRVQELFDFNYVVECYLPEAKRQYGYFCLPILLNDTFVARFDPKVDRINKIFHIKSFHAEKNWNQNEECMEALAKKIKLFALFNGCEKINVGINVPVALKKMFR